MVMVDQDARNIAANVLGEFMRASISTEEYERMYPKSELDPSLQEIYFQIWFLYSDMREHRLSGKHALNDEQSAIIKRCILFLKNDAEYKWPPQQFQPWQALLRFLGLGRKIEKMADGDESYWPFFDKTQYQEAIKCI